MVVRREEEINKFVSDAFFEINVNFITSKGEYTGKYFDKILKKIKENQLLKKVEFGTETLLWKLLKKFRDKKE